MSMRAKDIAKMTGVSVSTVSLVINDRPGVSDAKRRQILNTIKEQNCEYLLRNARSERENIGFIVYKRNGRIIDESPFFSYFLEGITERLKKLNYNLTMLYINSAMSKIKFLFYCKNFDLYIININSKKN